MSLLLIKLRTVLALGLPSLWRVLVYRLGIKSGINPVRRIHADLPLVPFFSKPESKLNEHLSCNKQWYFRHSYFGWFSQDNTSCPEWHKNPFNGKSVIGVEKNWWEIPDFDPEFGDIKTVWEASRFDWVIGLAQHATQGDQKALDLLNQWLIDWCKKNPAYKGPNWKCGQEASIRVMHIAFAARLLDQYENGNESLKQFIQTHLLRIAPTLGYAIAQNNNHGTSEAAALFIGGSWLVSMGIKEGERYQNIGRKLLENRARKLIERDGSFSQYSVNYHRVMLDTYSMAEYWRKLFKLPEFSPQFYERLRSATDWLFQMTQAENGDAPNLGANDGARLLPLTETDYRDFRPSVQLASVLFCEKRAYSGDGEWNLPLQWLSIDTPAEAKPPAQSSYFPQGGYSVLCTAGLFALFHIPKFRFRPSQADALHVDLWFEGKNLLRDGGTYSYNASDEVTQYFGGTASHNTIQFDDRDQMPRLSRFLFGSWLKAKRIIPVTEAGNEIKTAGGYRDYLGASHHRALSLSKNVLKVTDKVSGFKQKAILRWRLSPGKWVVNENRISDGNHLLRVISNVPMIRFEIIEGLESRYYLQKTSLPVLEVEINQAGQLTSEYSLTS